MSSAIFKIQIKVHDKTVLFASNKSQPFHELKLHCSVAYGTIVLCLFSKQTGKEEIFLTFFSAWVMTSFRQMS